VEAQLSSAQNASLASGRYLTDNVKSVLLTALHSVIMTQDTVTAAWMDITLEKTRCNASCVQRIVCVVMEKENAWSVKKKEL